MAFSPVCKIWVIYLNPHFIFHNLAQKWAKKITFNRSSCGIDLSVISPEGINGSFDFLHADDHERKKVKFCFKLIVAVHPEVQADCSKVIRVAVKLTDAFSVDKIRWKWKTLRPNLLKTQVLHVVWLMRKFSVFDFFVMVIIL